jgi:MFS family permease
LVAAVAIGKNLDESTPAPKATLRSAVSKQLVLVAITFGTISMAGLVLAALLLGGAVSQPLGGLAFGWFGGRTVFLVASVSTSALIGVFAISDGAVSLVAVAGIAFFLVSLFPVALAESVGDIRTALAWQLLLALLGIAFAMQIKDTAVQGEPVTNASP